MPIAAKDIVIEQDLRTVTLSHLIGDAQSIMLGYGYKQLPVVDDKDCPIGLIKSSRLIQQIREYGSDFELQPISNADIEEPHIALHTKDIFNLLDNLNRPSAILLVNESNKLVKIITSRDIASYFRARVEDLLLLGFIKNCLKANVINVLGESEVDMQIVNSQLNSLTELRKHNLTEGLKQKINSILSANNCVNIQYETEITTLINSAFPFINFDSINDLSLAELIHLVVVNWGKFEVVFKKFPLPMWSKMMDNVKLVQEKVFNFKEKVDKPERENLRSCATWYERISPIERVEDVTDPWNV